LGKGWFHETPELPENIGKGHYEPAYDGNIDAGNGCEHDDGDDGEGDEDEPYEEEDLDDKEEGGSDSEGDKEDELGPEDGEDGDWDDDNNEHGFADF